MKLNIHRVISSVALLTILLGTQSVLGYEQPLSLKAGDILDAALLRGTDFTVAEKVSNDGYTNTYSINSSFGPFEAHGNSMLQTRIQEIEGIARLKEVSSSEAFAKAAAKTVVKPVGAITKIAEDPGGTVKGIPGGVKRKFENLGRAFKKGSKEEKIDPVEGEEEVHEDSAATSVTKSVLGVTAAHRSWAKKMEVDPYSTNTVLQEELDRLAKVDAAASLTVRTATRDMRAARTITRVSDLVWGLDPQELQKLNEKKLKEMGVEPDLMSRFVNNKHITVTQQTMIVSSLEELKQTKDRPEFIHAAATALSERDAFIYVDSASILTSMQKAGRPITRFIPNPRIAVVSSGKTFVAVLPTDMLYWTKSFADALNLFEKNNAVTLKQASGKEMWVSGSCSQLLRKELSKRGWTIREKVTGSRDSG